MSRRLAAVAALLGVSLLGHGPAQAGAGKGGLPENRPAQAPAVEAPAPPLPPARQDWWAAGGFTLLPSGGVVGYRVEAGKPVPVGGYPGLRLLLAL